MKQLADGAGRVGALAVDADPGDVNDPDWRFLAQIARDGCYQVVGDVVVISKRELAALGRRAGYRSDEKYANLDD